MSKFEFEEVVYDPSSEALYESEVCSVLRLAGLTESAKGWRNEASPSYAGVDAVTKTSTGWSGKRQKMYNRALGNDNIMAMDDDEDIDVKRISESLSRRFREMYENESAPTVKRKKKVKKND